MCSLLVGSDWDSSPVFVQKILSLRKKQAPGSQWGFLWTHCHSLDNFFRVRVNESGPKSGENSIALLETKKVILLICRLKVYKKRPKMSFLLTVETNRKSTRLCQTCNVFCAFYGTSWCMLDCDKRIFFFKNGDGHFPFGLVGQYKSAITSWFVFCVCSQM